MIKPYLIILKYINYNLKFFPPKVKTPLSPPPCQLTNHKNNIKYKISNQVTNKYHKTKYKLIKIKINSNSKKFHQITLSTSHL